MRVNGERGIRVGDPQAGRREHGRGLARASSRRSTRVNAAFPQIHVVPVINQGNFIERSIANVAHSVLYGGALAVLVLLFFLRNLRSTLVISLAIPISVVGDLRADLLRRLHAQPDDARRAGARRRA